MVTKSVYSEVDATDFLMVDLLDGDLVKKLVVLKVVSRAECWGPPLDSILVFRSVD